MKVETTRRSTMRRAPGWFVGKWGSIACNASCDNQNNERDIPNCLLLQRWLPEAIGMQIFKRQDDSQNSARSAQGLLRQEQSERHFAGFFVIDHHVLAMNAGDFVYNVEANS